MQKTFYTSGFLFNTKLHKILLLKSQKKGSDDFLWSTMGGEGHTSEDPQDAFQRIINEQLGIKVKPKAIYPIYDYFQDDKGEDNFVFYAEVKSGKNFPDYRGNTYTWVGFDEISKLKFATGKKQDIIVGERVINAKWRDEEAKKQPDVFINP